jgi:hypothetical protein
VANAGSDTLTVLLNQGGAGLGFTSLPPLPTGRRPVSIDPFDPDADKDLDLAVACQGDNTVSLTRNIGQLGTFVPAPPSSMQVGSGPVQVIDADLNRDGKPDLIVVNQDGGSVSVIVNTGNVSGNPTFAPHVELPVGTGPSSIVQLDLDQDGDPDLAVLAVVNGSARVQVLRNDMNGGSQLQFAPATTLDAGSRPLFLVSTDVDRNGREDLVAVNASLRTPQSEVRTIRNDSTPPCPADWDRNGVIQPADIAVFVTDWFNSLQAGTLLGDFDRNGRVEPADIGVYVSEWFSALAHGC